MSENENALRIVDEAIALFRAERKRSVLDVFAEASENTIADLEEWRGVYAHRLAREGSP